MPKIKDLLSEQEKGLRKAIWWILRELHQESDVELWNKFNYDFRKNDEDISTIRQRRAARFLENVGAIDIVSVKYANNPNILALNIFSGKDNREPIGYEIEPHKENLLELYKEYEAFFAKDKPKSLSFDSVAGKLKYKKYSIVFGASSNSFPILDVLINSTDQFYVIGDTMNREAINEIATQDGSIEEISEKTYYNTIDYINKKFANKTGIEKDFLVKRNTEVGINDDLLKDLEEN
ncbi:MAG: hypothetical protein HQ530_01880 [Parcubacteria group bacterium]|nr:hypothetical protein [Parcubacteria group bacterium]